MAAEIRAWPDGVQRVIERELARGNRITEIDYGFPAPPVGAIARMEQSVATASGADLDVEPCRYPNWDNSAGFKDAAKGHFFVLGPEEAAPEKPKPEPIPSVDYVPPPRQPTGGPVFDRFVKSMQIDYEKWREGIGYDLEAIAEANDEDRAQIVQMLIRQGLEGWRDVQALAAIGSEQAKEALREAMRVGTGEVRMAVLDYAPELADDAERTKLIVRALETGEFYADLTRALDWAAEFHPPEVEDALWRGIRDREGGIACHFAALLMYIHGQAKSRFDWDHRPFFLKFNTDSPTERASMLEELKRRLGKRE